MRLSRSAATLVAVAVLSLSGLTACGGDSDGDSDGGSGGGADAGSGPDPVAAVDDAQAEDSGDTGSGDTGSGDGTSVRFDDCSAVSAEEMAGVAGMSPGTAQVSPGGGQCEYSPTDPVQPSVYVEQAGTDDYADGFDGARANVGNDVAGPLGGLTTTSVEVGDGAEIATGTNPITQGESLQSISVLLLGDTVVKVTILQAVDLDEAALVDLTTGVLTLLASKG